MGFQHVWSKNVRSSGILFTFLWVSTKRTMRLVMSKMLVKATFIELKIWAAETLSMPKAYWGISDVILLGWTKRMSYHLIVLDKGNADQTQQYFLKSNHFKWFVGIVIVRCRCNSKGCDTLLWSLGRKLQSV